MRIPCAVATLLLCFACRSSSRDETPATPTEAAPTIVATPTEARAPKPETPEEKAKKAAERKAKAIAALARVPEIKEGLAKLRGLPFKSDVAAEYQEEPEFRAFVQKEIAKELPPERAEAMSTAYVQLGLLETPIDLRKTLEDALVSQAGAYYDPATKKYYLVMVPAGGDSGLDMITAHELTHALQDQHFDLEKYYPHDEDGRPTLSEDAMAARRFVVEGEATFAMIAYLVTAATRQAEIPPAVLPMLKTQLEALAAMDIDSLKAMTKAQAAGVDVGDDIEEAMKAMDSIPLVLMLPLLESYTRGALPSMVAFQHGGWAEIAKLYKNPPESSEQVLHPSEKLIPTRDRPSTIALPAPPAGFTVVNADDVGELGWRVYFQLWNAKAADKLARSDKAAAGWDGDRYAVLRGADGELVVELATTWDSPAEAEEFERAYKASLATRFGGDGSRRPDGAPLIVSRRGADVFVLDGAAPPGRLAALEKSRIARR